MRFRVTNQESKKAEEMYKERRKERGSKGKASEE